mmetsp:Transcript_4747/g.5624  ORF Transcript_4747/g.5624 Transcript_4747/m.5624 type:complete len:99 (-) Transcript_4747:150-446(-)|eukprot:Skav216959  [mRNA]  locus=scaffold2531:98890:99186:+ [translate_table: standard]
MALRIVVTFALMASSQVAASRFGSISSQWSNFGDAALDNPWAYHGTLSPAPPSPVYAQVQLGETGPVVSQSSPYGPLRSENGVAYTQSATVQAHVVAR